MAKSTDTKRFAVLGHQRVSRYELEDMRAYTRLATALIVTFAAACEELLEAIFAKWLALEEGRTGPSVERA